MVWRLYFGWKGFLVWFVLLAGSTLVGGHYYSEFTVLEEKPYYEVRQSEIDEARWAWGKTWLWTLFIALVPYYYFQQRRIRQGDNVTQWFKFKRESVWE